MSASVILLDLMILEIFGEYPMIALMIYISVISAVVTYYVINAQCSLILKSKA
jgi:hypothetical protein